MDSRHLGRWLQVGFTDFPIVPYYKHPADVMPHYYTFIVFLLYKLTVIDLLISH